jgi:predicted nucleotidyltransferase
MAMKLPPDFKEFLALLEQNSVKYVLIGGYAVGLHGYPRATSDIDIYIPTDTETATQMAETLDQFGFSGADPTLFSTPSSITRVGIKPTQLEITNFIDGVNFEECFDDRIRKMIDGLEINVISLEKLRKNKQASGRPKDLDDLKNLPK